MFKLSSVSGIDEYGQLYFDVTFEKDGLVTEKRLSVEDYQKLINLSVEEKVTFIEVPEMPDNVFKLFLASDGAKDSFQVLFYYDAAIRPFSYYGKVMMLPFPSLLFDLQVEKGQIKEKCVYALKEKVSEEARLYHYPYGNVSDSGAICMGSINTKINGINDISYFFDNFIYSRTNNDYTQNKNIMALSQKDLIEHVSKMTRFPDDILLAKNETVHDLLKRRRK